MLVRPGRWLTARPGADIGCMRTFVGEKQDEDLKQREHDTVHLLHAFSEVSTQKRFAYKLEFVTTE